MQLASYLEGGPLIWMMPLHLHVNQKSDCDDDMSSLGVRSIVCLFDSTSIVQCQQDYLEKQKNIHSNVTFLNKSPHEE